MVADLSFWQEFGPFVVAVTVGVVVSGALVFVGSRAAKVYEKALVSRAERFRALSQKLRKSKRSSYEETVEKLKEKADGARKFQLVGIYGGTVFLSYHAARLIVGESGVDGLAKWGIVLGMMSAITAIIAYLERRAARAHRIRLDNDSALDLEEAIAQ